MSQKHGKEFDVITAPGKGRTKKVTLPIVAESAEDARKLAEPIRMRRRLGPIIETKEKKP